MGGGTKESFLPLIPPKKDRLSHLKILEGNLVILGPKNAIFREENVFPLTVLLS